MHGESLHLRREAGIEMIIAIDSTRRGPALGGCRWRPYRDAAEARREASALAASMTRKAALARLALGGGKAVVVGDPSSRTREQLLAFGDFVASLDGRYVTAADMGTGAEQMAVIAERTPHVVGLPPEQGGCGDPAPFTAQGVCMAMQAALRHAGESLSGMRVAVQGVGHVGAELVRQCLRAGANVAAADPDARALDSLPPEVERVDPRAILELECDVLAPCGPPAVISTGLVERLRCRVVCGAANNPLENAAIARLLDARGILFVPDYVANAGGLIHLAVAREGRGPDAAQDSLRVIPENVDAVLEMAKVERIDPARAGERLAAAAVGEDIPDLG